MRNPAMLRLTKPTARMWEPFPTSSTLTSPRISLGFGGLPSKKAS